MIKRIFCFICIFILILSNSFLLVNASTWNLPNNAEANVSISISSLEFTYDSNKKAYLPTGYTDYFIIQNITNMSNKYAITYYNLPETSTSGQVQYYNNSWCFEYMLCLEFSSIENLNTFFENPESNKQLIKSSYRSATYPDKSPKIPSGNTSNILYSSSEYIIKEEYISGTTETGMNTKTMDEQYWTTINQNRYEVEEEELQSSEIKLFVIDADETYNYKTYYYAPSNFPNIAIFKRGITEYYDLVFYDGVLNINYYGAEWTLSPSNGGIFTTDTLENINKRIFNNDNKETIFEYIQSGEPIAAYTGGYDNITYTSGKIGTITNYNLNGVPLQEYYAQHNDITTEEDEDNKTILEKVGEWFKNLIDTISNFCQNFKDWTANIAIQIGDFFESILQSISDFFRMVNDWHEIPEDSVLPDWWHNIEATIGLNLSGNGFYESICVIKDELTSLYKEDYTDPNGFYNLGITSFTLRKPTRTEYTDVGNEIIGPWEQQFEKTTSKIDYGIDNMQLLNLDWFFGKDLGGGYYTKGVKEYSDTIIGSFMWLIFGWYLFHSFPELIGGELGMIQDFSSPLKTQYTATKKLSAKQTTKKSKEGGNDE